jgi:hypothetical protein
MTDFTNADRAKRAKAALKHFYSLAHATDDTHPIFDEALETARGHFEAEQKGEE